MSDAVDPCKNTHGTTAALMISMYIIFMNNKVKSVSFIVLEKVKNVLLCRGCPMPQEGVRGKALKYPL